MASQPTQNIDQLSESYVTIAQFLDQNGIAYTPTSLRYRIDDLSNNAQVLAWTPISPAPNVVITIPSALNEMTNLNDLVEIRQVLLEITAPGGALRYDDVTYNLIRIFGLT